MYIMMPNITRTEEGAEIYQHRINEITDSFMEQLDDPQEISETPYFRLLLKEIYIQIFMPMEPQQFNAGSNLDLNNVSLLNHIWSLFTTLCYRCKTTPTINRFCLMTGINPHTVTNWSQQNTREGNSGHYFASQKWLKECEGCVEDNVIAKNSVGGIFTLKACYNWRESAPVVQEGYITAVESTPEQIRERYKDAKRPELPDLD